jgi:catechol 2,3-dioxygenase-like lactoylglutathione lyase family enzyme
LSSLGLAELVLIVEDVPASARFYEGVVGLAPENEPSDDWAWFWVGKEGVPQRLALHRGPLLFEEHSPYPEGERFGRVHFAFEVARDELDTAVERVREAGVAVHGPVELDWMDAESYYFYDPEATCSSSGLQGLSGSEPLSLRGSRFTQDMIHSGAAAAGVLRD